MERLLRRGGLKVLPAPFQEGVEAPLQASSDLFFEFSPKIFHRVRFQRPDRKQLGVDSTCVFEPFAQLAARVPRRLVPDHKDLSFGLLE